MPSAVTLKVQSELIEVSYDGILIAAVKLNKKQKYKHTIAKIYMFVFPSHHPGNI